MSKLSELSAAASQVVSIAVPLIKIAQPGSPMAQTLATVLETGVKYLRFADKLESVHLAELAKDFAAIKADVEDMAAKGDSVPQEKWEAVKAKAKSAADRMRAV